jgi:hypothetical protein
LQFREMQRRHQDALLVLRKIRSTDIPPSQAGTEIRGLLERTLMAPAPTYRRYMDQLTNESCAAMAALHNSSTPEQRARLLQTLKSYEGDARALANQRPDEPPTDHPVTAF